MKKIIAVTNQKGGVGKSSTVLSLGAGLRLMNYKVLFIDLDAQGNLSHTMNVSFRGDTAFTVLTRRKNIRDVIQKTPLGDCLCASDELSGADIAISETGKEYRLKEALEEVKGLYDYVVIDTPPALGILTVNTLAAADDVIIPSQADIYSFQGIQKLESNIESVRKYCNHTLAIAGILLTRFNGRCILSRDVASGMKTIAVEMNTKVFSTKIRECIAMKESQMAKTDIYSYDPKSNAAIDYAAFVKEYAGGIND
jgi:chromosome partitioning protein